MFGLKYYEGANPGKRKWELVKIDDEKKKQKSKEYETKRTRVLCDSWSKDRKWLKYDEENKVMTCVLCIQYYSVNEIIEFFFGQVNFAGLQDIWIRTWERLHQYLQFITLMKIFGDIMKAIYTLGRACKKNSQCMN